MEVSSLKNKLTRDLQQSARETDDKVKAFKQISDQSIQTMRESMETAIKEMNATVTKCNEKVEKIIPTDQLLHMINNTISGLITSLTE